MSDRFPQDRPFYCPELLVLRHQAAIRRAAAMLADFDSVAGIRLAPITPASWSRLVAIDSAFIYHTNGPTPTRADIRNYVWLHHPRFTMDEPEATKAKAAVIRQLDFHIGPPWTRWRYSRAAWHTLTAAGYAVAAGTIAEIIDVTFADRPPPSTSGHSVGASLEAQLVDLFASQYQFWPLPTPIQHTPLRKLYQLLRCANPSKYDSDEAAIIAADLARENSAALAEKKP